MIWFYRLFIAPLILYIAATLAAATFAGIDPRLAPLFQQLPGTRIWPALIDLDARVLQFPLPVIVIAILVLIMSMVLAYANKLAREATVAREEAIRERVRKEGR